MARRMHLAWVSVVTFFPCISDFTPQMIDAGLLVAYIRADSTISSSPNLVISATFAGGYCVTRSLNSSNPWHQVSTKSLS